MDLPHPPRAWRLRRGLLLASVALGGVSPRFVRRPPECEGDAPGPGTAVQHAQLVAGGTGLCALTTLRGGASQVVCAEVDERSGGLDRRLVSRTWESPPLLRLIPQVVRHSPQRSFEAEPIALGLLASGEVVRFDHESAGALPLPLPPTGAHGTIVTIDRHTSAFGGCIPFGDQHGRTLARTQDGAVLGTTIADPRDGHAWTVLLPAGEGAAGDFAWIDELPCVATRHGARCARPDPGRDDSSDLRLLDLAIDVPDLAGLVAAGPWLCAHDRAGALHCALRGRADGHWRPVPMRGAPPHVDAAVASDTDLCVRAPPSRWSCVVGPSSEASVALSEAPWTLRGEPLLDGAADVALTIDGGCARWPGGAMGCWGRHRRGGGFERRGPTEIRGLRDVNDLAASHGGTCALTRGEVWCWGALGPASRRPYGTPRPERVPLPGPARALASDGRTFAAVGGTVFAWEAFGPPVTSLRNPPGDGAPIESLVAVSEAVCARRVDGRVTCWREEWDAAGRPGRRDDVPSRVRRLEGRARFGAVQGEVCAWDPSRGGSCWDLQRGDDGSNPRRPRAVRPRDVEAPVRVEGDCAVYSDGDRRCVHDEEEQPALIPSSLRPPWTIDPSSEDGVRFHMSYGGYLLLPGGRLASVWEDDRNAVLHQHMRFSFPGLMPGLSDVRAFVLGWPEGRSIQRGHGCALRGDGRVLCWGLNHGDSLSIDDADRAPRLVPLLRCPAVDRAVSTHPVASSSAGR